MLTESKYGNAKVICPQVISPSSPDLISGTQLKDQILVVEDTPINQKVIQAQLKCDFDIILASTGKEALELCLREDNFKVILLDIGLPDISGFEIAKAIRELNNSLRYAPIIAHSAFLEDLIKENCKNAGIDDLLTKPSSCEQIIETIKFWIGKRHY